VSGDNDVKNPPGGGEEDELRRAEEFLGLPPEEWENLKDVKEAAPLSENNVAGDRYDERIFSELSEESQKLGGLLGNQEAPETFPDLVEDLFRSFYKAQPDLLPEGAVEPARREANRPFIERLLDDPETYNARATTRLDELSSALAALSAGKKILEEIEKRPDLKEFVEGAAKASAEQQPEPPTADLRRAAREAAKAAEEEADDLAGALAGWGLSPADLKRVPLQERLELARRLRSPDLRRVADLLGRMRNLARARAREKVSHRRDEVHSISAGRPEDPSRLLPSELGALASKDRLRRLDLYRRWAEGSVLRYELAAQERKARGPIVAMVDSSGSMGGERMERAVAVSLALVDLASGRSASGRRHSAVLFFNTEVVFERRFAPGERDPRKLLSVATVGASGGTDYEPAIGRALEIAAEHEHKGADLLLVTDGRCTLPDDFVADLLAEKARRSMSLYSVLIGVTEIGELSRYSEEVWALSGGLAGMLPGGEAAGEIFSRIA
jgi:uncharacterized protein with von Willebrand factor type A (vWA) domain